MKQASTFILAITVICLIIKAFVFKFTGTIDNRYRGDDLGYE